jgi:hypothetical protein
MYFTHVMFYAFFYKNDIFVCIIKCKPPKSCTSASIALLAQDPARAPTRGAVARLCWLLDGTIAKGKSTTNAPLGQAAARARTQHASARLSRIFAGDNGKREGCYTQSSRSSGLPRCGRTDPVGAQLAKFSITPQAWWGLVGAFTLGVGAVWLPPSIRAAQADARDEGGGLQRRRCD